MKIESKRKESKQNKNEMKNAREIKKKKIG